MDAVRRLAEVCARRGLKVSAAESCTGGMIGAAITGMPGSSSFFLGSAVVYANEAKEDLLKVPRGILFEYGAVSEQTAKQMARGALALYHSDVAVSVTGIAGPGGATDTKPVGLVYIATFDGSKAVAKKFVFKGDREVIREQAAEEALSMLIEACEGLA